MAQDIEPRRWTPLPVGLNITGLGFVHTDGDIALDPVLELDDVKVKRNTVVASYLHALDFFGKSARFDVRVPYQRAEWKGLLKGASRTEQRTGFADPRIRLSINFLGAPALKKEELREYRAAHPINTVVGAAVAVTLPLGEYKRDKLLNLGKNRFVIRPQVGFVHTRGSWSYELTGSVSFFTDNDEFFGNSKREQDPLFAGQTHLVYSSRRGWWVSIGTGYDYGGESKIDGVKKDDRRREVLFGISTGFAFHRTSSVKIAYVGSRTRKDIGADTDNLAIAYSIRF